MKDKTIGSIWAAILILMALGGCKIPQMALKSENRSLPDVFLPHSGRDTSNIARLNWRTYFADSNLISLIDSALLYNQELNIIWQELAIGQNEVLARSGEYQPFVRWGAGAGVDKVGKFTRFGALEDQLELKPGKRFPEPLQDYSPGFVATWEVDIWKKLRNAKKAAVMRYLASVEGKNFMVTNLIAEIADAYYELMAMDNLLAIIDQSIAIQSDALKVVEQQKTAAKVTQLAVNRFQAQLLNTQNLRFVVQQQIVETENRIHFLTGKPTVPIVRNSSRLLAIQLDTFPSGIPAQLLLNRPDVRQAEQLLAASRLDVAVARANFLPSLGIRANLGLQSVNLAYLLNPESILFNLAGDLAAPLVNKKAIDAAYKTANAQQIQAVYRYEQSILNAFVDVRNQLAKMDNFSKSYATKNQEVDILNQSIRIATTLFNSARADYGEVLFTQREALASKMEIVEIKMQQLSAKVNLYRALGGGWQ